MQNNNLVFKSTSEILLAIFFMGAATLFFGCASTSPSGKKMTAADRSRVFVEIANGALAEGDPTGALQNLARAEVEDSQLPELHHSKALAYYAKHNIEAATDSARRAVKLKPDYADANNTLGKLLLDQGRYDEATEMLLIAAKDPLYRESYKSWTSLGIVEYKRGHWVQSKNYFNKAILSSPVLACIAFYYRGNLYLREAKINDAIHDYVNASQKACTSFGQAHLALSVAYEKNKQFQLARKTLLDIQERYPRTQLAEKAFEQLKHLP